MIPRFRGNAIEQDGKWGWEVYVTPLGSNEVDFAFGNVDVFPTKEEAIQDMLKAVQFACDVFNEENGMPTRQYIDMKTNETLKFDKSKHN